VRSSICLMMSSVRLARVLVERVPRCRVAWGGYQKVGVRVSEGCRERVGGVSRGCQVCQRGVKGGVKVCVCVCICVCSKENRQGGNFRFRHVCV
jgi:hypothetical protein